MNYFAKIVNGIVVDVIVIAKSDCGNLQFPESEQIGQRFIASCGIEGKWLQTSLTNQYRKHFAVIGCEYNEIKDKFLLPFVPQPFPSWILDSDNDWQAPTPRPEQDGFWQWNEIELKWDR